MNFTMVLVWEKGGYQTKTKRIQVQDLISLIGFVRDDRSGYSWRPHVRLYREVEGQADYNQSFRADASMPDDSLASGLAEFWERCLTK